MTTTTRYQYTSIRKLKTDGTNCWEGMEGPECPYTASGSVKWCGFGSFLTVKHTTYHVIQLFHSQTFAPKKRNICPYKDLCMSISCSLICNCQYLETTDMSTNIQREKQLVMYLHSKMYMCSIAKSCPALCDPMDCSPPGSSVHGTSQPRMLVWVAITFSRGSSQRTRVSFLPRDRTHVSGMANYH